MGDALRYQTGALQSDEEPGSLVRIVTYISVHFNKAGGWGLAYVPKLESPGNGVTNYTCRYWPHVVMAFLSGESLEFREEHRVGMARCASNRTVRSLDYQWMTKSESLGIGYRANL